MAALNKEEEETRSSYRISIAQVWRERDPGLPQWSFQSGKKVPEVALKSAAA